MTRELAVPLSVIDARLMEIDREIQRLKPLEIERALLLQLREKAVGRKGRKVSPLVESDGGLLRFLPLTEQIANCVGNNPGFTRDQIAEHFQGLGKDRRIVLTTISNLLAKGRIERDGKGGFIPVARNGRPSPEFQEMMQK